jgi:hypothetical protein
MAHAVEFPDELRIAGGVLLPSWRRTDEHCLASSACQNENDRQHHRSNEVARPPGFRAQLARSSVHADESVQRDLKHASADELFPKTRDPAAKLAVMPVSRYRPQKQASKSWKEEL